MPGQADHDPPLVVLQSFRAPDPKTNPYLTQLLASIPSSIRVETFSWRRAIRERYDVFHCHWPEHLIRSKYWRQRWFGRALFVAFLIRLQARHVAVVRTVHNVNPHEKGDRVERALLRLLDRKTSLWITLTDQTPMPSDAKVRVIPHGHYRDWYMKYDIPEIQPGRLLFFGLIRAYKGVDELIDSFIECADPNAELRIVGSGADPGLKERINLAIKRDHRITAHLAHATDQQLAEEIGRAGAVVLPYREMHNSGALLLTLSLGRRASVPASDVAEALSTEVGPGWVSTFQAPCDSTVVADAIDQSRLPLPTRPPDLSTREWDRIGTLHAAAYRDAVRP